MVKDVDWRQYFQDISGQCPWSNQAYEKGLIDIVDWQGQSSPLANFKARVYVCDLSNKRLRKLCLELDQQSQQDEWLFSYPGYGPFAAPCKILIQQDRKTLQYLRDLINI